MCLGGGGGGNNDIAQQQLQLAQQQNRDLEQQNAEKKANILAGQGSIDSAFAQFNPAYYAKYQKAFTNAEAVPLAQQYARAKDTADAGLAGRGIGASSVGNQFLADIDQRNAAELGKISNMSSDAVNAQKLAIENAKSNLYSLNSAGNDPTAISANAIGSASALVNPAKQPPLGNIFADLLTPLSSYYRAGTGSSFGSSGVGGAPSAIG